MYVDGKKYACDACVRGHRVSGCNHNDRPLQEIAKKGRPVSQCQHCRSLRKSRSSHVKCDCGEKTKGIPKHHYINENGKLVELDDAKEASLCQCPHGGRCTCSVKKDYLERVPETSGSTTPGSSTSSDGPRKPRLQTTQSDSSLTRFTNGHHRPVHRHHSSHGTAPYHIPLHHHHTVSESLHEKINDVDLTSPHGHIIMPSDPEEISSPFSRQMLNRQIKSENGSPSVGSTGYPDVSDNMVPPSLSRTISDFNLSGSRGMIELTLQTDLPAFETPDFSAREFYFSAVESEGVPFSAFNHPNSASWPYETNFDNFCEVPPGLTQSVSGDDSEVENWGYNPLPSPIHNVAPGYLSGPFSAESSDFYESDHHDGLSTVSSRVGLSNITAMPANDLGAMENYLNAGFDGSGYSLSGQEGVALADFGLDDMTSSTLDEAKAINPTDLGSLGQIADRGSSIFPDSEVLMMVPVTNQAVPLPPDFQAR